MIVFEEARHIVLDSAIALEMESVPLSEAHGRILYEDISSDVDMPPFDKSAMDGYACRVEDIDKPLKVVETIAAGYTPQKTVGEGECSKIMTGGVVPDGADCVVMVEHTEVKDGFVYITKKGTQRNICYKAEDVKLGDPVLNKGTYIGPSEIAVLASVGCDPVPVSRRPVLGIIATGSELVEPSEKPRNAQIRNSNSYQIYSQVEQAGAIPVNLGIIKDSPEAIGETIEQNLSKVDIFLLSGGVSMGDYDYVPNVLKNKGFKLMFQKVAIKPGKPTVFGRNGNTFVFGLPGNPVSTFMIFELFVKPFCYKLMGSEYSPLQISAKVLEPIKRKKAKRLSHIPVVLNENGEIIKTKYHGSAHIHALSKANGFISIPIGVSEIQAGEHIHVTVIK
jgi:molybdopterin molybdotransferase